ncbi:MAG: MBL fold metallo-hydrolase [Lachnospiraceae bacterium]|nr:MBL fold metallo-hydrolase [Lachnospiraceae bacterium]
MRIINLIENTEGTKGCACAHGLSFYVETEKHRLLLDLGPSAETIKNAEKLGIDLKQVDTVILSHGHYDHSGGIIPFSEINPDAVIFMQASAGGDYYADDGENAGDSRYVYIGIDKDIIKLPQVKFIRGDLKIDDELELFTVKERTHKLPFANRRILIKKNGEYERDDFKHEHYLVINNGDRHILMSGCAHNGILSILDAYKEKYGSFPDAVISGFHLMKEAEYNGSELREVADMGRELKKYPTMFYTCHCTGEPAYKTMKLALGDQLEYVHSGEEIFTAQSTPLSHPPHIPALYPSAHVLS